MTRDSGKSPMRQIQKTQPNSNFIEKRARTILFALVGVNLASRIPLIWNNLPPYQFCDENIYFEEVLRMINNDDLIPIEYRAGGFNIYPAFLLINLLNLFLPVPLSYLQSLIVGKFLYVALLPSLSVIFAFKISRVYTSKKTSLTVSAVYSASLFFFMFFWYPDTYIQFCLLGFIYYFALILSGNRSPRILSLLGLFLGLSISTKWTALLLAIPILIWIGSMTREMRNLPSVLKNLFIVATSSITVILFLNAGIIFRTEKFLEGFKFNVENYGSTEGVRFSGFTFYTAVSLVNSFGVFWLIFTLGGIVFALKTRSTALVLMSLPIALIGILGDKQLVVPRHMASAIPFFLPFLAMGIQQFQSSKRFNEKLKIATISLGLGMSTLTYSYQVLSVLQADTRNQAEQWIPSRIPAKETVGTNEFCFGASPASVAGRSVDVDRNMSKGLNYYVFSSYWPHPASNAYLSKGVLTRFDQSKLHFEQWNSTKLFGPLGPPDLRSEYFPSNYRIIKTFRGNGPDILVLKKVQE